MAAVAPHLRKVIARPAPTVSARRAGLKYVSDEGPGIRRLKVGKSFKYVRPDGKPLKDEKALARINSLAIPPAWADVWICPSANGHVQASGRDVRGRKQHRYHPKWRESRDANKFDRMCAFGKLLPHIRRRTAADLGRPGLPKEKVLAAIVRIMSETFLRVGNEEYARTNKHYGLTTLQDRHAKLHPNGFCFDFVGKSGIRRNACLTDPKLAKVVRQCRDLPGQDLFQYLDESGKVRDITSTDVNEYLQAVTEHDITAKDFRTWAGTLLAARALCAVTEMPTSQTAAKRHVVAAIKDVAHQLGNTPAVCRKCYIHPGVLQAFVEGTLKKHFAAGSEERGLLNLLGRRA